MSKGKNKFVDDAIGSNRSADQFQCRIIRIVENKMIQVEVTQLRSANPSRQLVVSLSK